MSAPAVSVVMNCYNSSRFLVPAIESVFAQTVPDWEIIFWDNLSTDESPAIARRYEGKLKYFRGEHQLPLGAARNEAIARANGRYLAILDCDDLWEPTKLQQQLETVGRQPDVGLVYSDVYFINQDGRVLGRCFERTSPPVAHTPLDLLVSPNCISCPTVLMRRDSVVDAGGFNPALKYCEEYDLFVRIAERRPFARIDEPLARYRLHSANTTGFGTSKTTRELIDVIRTSAKRLEPLTVRDRARIAVRIAALRAKQLVQLAREAIGR